MDEGDPERGRPAIVGCNCHEIIGKALLCVRCRRWKHSSQVSGAALKMLASLKGGQAVELLGQEIDSKRGTKLPMCTKHSRCRLGPCAAVARPAAVCVCRSSSSKGRSTLARPRSARRQARADCAVRGAHQQERGLAMEPAPPEPCRRRVTAPGHAAAAETANLTAHF